MDLYFNSNTFATCYRRTTWCLLNCILTCIYLVVWGAWCHSYWRYHDSIAPTNNADNLKLFQEGNLSLDHGAHIVTQAFMDQFITVTGSGMTFGFVIFMIYRARSVQMKTIGKLTLAPAFFNINEPVLFGMPIVLNPILAFPFLIAPLVSGFGTYAAIALGIIPPFNGIFVPWTTPPILSGLIVGGWQGAAWQALMIFVTGAIYWPFAKNMMRFLYNKKRSI